MYVEIDNNIIINIIDAQPGTVPDGLVRVNDDFSGLVGDDARWYDWDNGGIRYDNNYLIKHGLLTDYSGDYWDKETREHYEILDPTQQPPEKWTDIRPPSMDVWVIWDDINQQWIEDALIKRQTEITNRIDELLRYLSSTDYTVIKAAEAGIDIDTMYPGVRSERQAARDEINSLNEKLTALDT